MLACTLAAHCEDLSGQAVGKVRLALLEDVVQIAQRIFVNFQTMPDTGRAAQALDHLAQHLHVADISFHLDVVPHPGHPQVGIELAQHGADVLRQLANEALAHRWALDGDFGENLDDQLHLKAHTRRHGKKRGGRSIPELINFQAVFCSSAMESVPTGQLPLNRSKIRSGALLWCIKSTLTVIRKVAPRKSAPTKAPLPAKERWHANCSLVRQVALAEHRRPASPCFGSIPCQRFHYLENTMSKSLQLIKDYDVKWIDLRFTDTKGKQHHVTIPARDAEDEDFFEHGKMFDGSSIQGWKGIEASDMILMPVDETAVLDPFTEEPTLILGCDIVEPSTMQGYDRDPRSIAKRAEEFLKSTGIGDTVFVGPEPEFFIFDQVKFKSDISGSMFKIYSEQGSWMTDQDVEGG